jgi:hypothetical protein
MHVSRNKMGTLNVLFDGYLANNSYELSKTVLFTMEGAVKEAQRQAGSLQDISQESYRKSR